MSSEDSNSMVLPNHHNGRSDKPAMSIPDARGSGLSEEDEFSTDDFRMYKLKVFPCFAAYVHDWTRCPNYHPGENARRRDPSTHNYSPLQCPDHRLGLCRKGDACEFAHGLFETWLHPAQYRIKICREGARCTRNVCFFAHNALELRPIFAETGCAQRQSPSEFSPTASPFRPEHNRSPETSFYETSYTGKIYGSQHRPVNMMGYTEEVYNHPGQAMLRTWDYYANFDNSTKLRKHQQHAYDSPLNQGSSSQSFSPAPNFNSRLNPGFVSRKTRFTTEGWQDGHNSQE